MASWDTVTTPTEDGEEVRYCLDMLTNQEKDLVLSALRAYKLVLPSEHPERAAVADLLRNLKG